eukprot:615837-Amphidinium_carterae.1
MRRCQLANNIAHGQDSDDSKVVLSKRKIDNPTTQHMQTQTNHPFFPPLGFRVPRRCRVGRFRPNFRVLQIIVRMHASVG